MANAGGLLLGARARAALGLLLRALVAAVALSALSALQVGAVSGRGAARGAARGRAPSRPRARAVTARAVPRARPVPRAARAVPKAVGRWLFACVCDCVRRLCACAEMSVSCVVCVRHYT